MTVRNRLAALAAGVLAFSVMSTTGAQADDHGYAPVDRPGPPLTSVDPDILAKSLVCTPGVTDATRSPVLLLDGTWANTDMNFSWNYGRTFTARGIPWCALDVRIDRYSYYNSSDLQTRGEYVTAAIRQVHEMSGQKVSILGWSQGGMIARWSLRFWPDTRTMVDDVVGLAPDNHGSGLIALRCCAAASWQQFHTSNFITALNSGQETFPGISYTTIRSDFDEIVVPSTSPVLTGPGSIANYRLQDRCPGHFAEHGQIGSFDAVGEAFVLDALTHPGPADISRIGGGVCFRLLMSGVRPLTFATDFAMMVTKLAVAFATSAPMLSEPPLRCYVRAEGC